MFLGGSILGYAYFLEAVQCPAPAAYTQIQFFGNCIVDTVHLRNVVLTDAEFNAIDPSIVSVWTDSTIMIANFTNNFEAGNITNLTTPITGWDVYRRVTGETSIEFLDRLLPTEVTYSDYYAATGKAYQHVIFPVTATQIGEPVVTNSIDAEFYGWFLVGEDSGGTYVYKFDINLDFGGFQNEEDFIEYPTYNKYNTFAKGNRDFLRGTLQALAGTISTTTSEFLQPVEYLDDLRTRINDSTTKTLKSRKGEVYKIKTHQFSMIPLDNNIGEQPYMIGFEFIQSEDV